MSRLVYLGEPIDQSARGSTHSDCVADMLASDGHLVYRPRRAFTVGAQPRPHAGVERVNRSALAESEVLVAIMPKGVASIGLPREIEAFAQASKPWAVLTDFEHSFSLMDATLRAPLTPDGYRGVIEWVGNLPESSAVSDLVFAKVDPHDGQLPTRAHAGDAGLDLYAAEDVHIPYDQFRDVSCGVRVALPHGVWARIVGRSSTMRRRGLLVTEGIIDGGYRGPLFAGVRNLNGKGVTVERGERIAQLILMSNLAPKYAPRWASAAEFAAIPHDGRGEAGFGSTGH